MLLGNDLKENGVIVIVLDGLKYNCNFHYGLWLVHWDLHVHVLQNASDFFLTGIGLIVRGMNRVCKFIETYPTTS